MKKLIIHTSVIISILVLGIFWIGCSNDTIEVISTPGTGVESNPVEFYFPLTQGYTVEYDIYTSESQHEVKQFTVGETVELASGNAVEWFSYSTKAGLDTGYFRSTSEALYYYDNPVAGPEKILILPLLPGYNWLREGDNSDLATNNDNDFDDDKNENNTYDGGTLAKNFPTYGETNMSVEKIESLLLDNGSYYSGVVNIVSDNGSGIYNRYWFAPGVGMVRYVLNASASNPDGSEHAELRSYGTE